MQRTRLSTLVDTIVFKLQRFYRNPWRRISVLVIGFLGGIFVAQALSTTGGQEADWDIVMATFVLLFTEGVSIFVYRLPRKQSSNLDIRYSLFTESLNMFKIGITYSMFLEAFKLGS
ncbi:protein of unknown function DUF565 [Gloeothece citriformis PCC 7424]|uniref:DUF565 domain-containing protein n=1 Tax=Gloeothece citriformis (strain PCC 7424) TaxID=65393 RepID=B7KC00_GLOC7|nr:DUF565 domain-containing protein [Gloeothece citriformis]ACK68823.1 protein of unknown function DUF565 [Gloeothece citriformis PCC 7424]